MFESDTEPDTVFATITAINRLTGWYFARYVGSNAGVMEGSFFQEELIKFVKTYRFIGTPDAIANEYLRELETGNLETAEKNKTLERTAIAAALGYTAASKSMLER